MKEIIEEEPKTFKVELTLEEVKYIRDYTQNYCGEDPRYENESEKGTRLKLFVGASRLLGVDMPDDGRQMSNILN